MANLMCKIHVPLVKCRIEKKNLTWKKNYNEDDGIGFCIPYFKKYII
jgi:hypothetical protein